MIRLCSLLMQLMLFASFCTACATTSVAQPIAERRDHDHDFSNRDRHRFDRRPLTGNYNQGWFQRPYPYHLDYYKREYGGSYAPYFGNLYGPPRFIVPPYGSGYGYPVPYGYFPPATPYNYPSQPYNYPAYPNNFPSYPSRPNPAPPSSPYYW